MASAGTVTVDFAAEVARFNAQMKQVNDRVGRVESGFKSLQKVADQALKFLSVGVAARFVQSAGEAADAIGKMADKLGISTQRLVAFQQAADDAGVETSTFNKLLSDAERKLGEASGFKGGAFEAIQRLGLDVRELQALSPDQLFLRYADAINTVRNRSEQFALAQNLFGDAARDAFNLIEAGRPAIEKAAADVDRLGLALNRVDTAKIEAANDALGLLAKTSQAFGQHLAAAFAPFTEEIANRLTETSAAANKAQSDLDLFARGAFIAFEVVANGARTFDLAVSAAFAAIAKGNELLFASLRKGLEFTASIDRFLHLDSLAQTFDSFATQVGDAENFSAALSENAVARVKAAADGIKSFAQIFAEADEIVANSQAKAEAAAAKASANNASLGQVGGLQVENATATNALIEQLQKSHFDRLLDMQDEFQRQSAAFTRELVEEHARAQRAREQAAREAERNIQIAQEQTAVAGVGLLTFLVASHGKTSKAISNAQKAQALIATYRNTAQAASLAIATIPPPLGFVAAAANVAFGLIQAKAILSDSPPYGGGSASVLGVPSNPVFTDSGGTDTQTFGAQQKSQINVIVEGVITPGSARAIADALKDVIDNADVHIIGENSSQANALRGG